MPKFFKLLPSEALKICHSNCHHRHSVCIQCHSVADRNEHALNWGESNLGSIGRANPEKK